MILELKNIHRIYETNGHKTQALNKVNLTINSGDQIMITGASGSGKSTLLNIIGLLDKGYTGEYLINGTNRKKYSSKNLAMMRNTLFGYIFQEYALIESGTVYENVRIPLIYSNIKKRDHGPMIETVLEAVDLLDMKMKKVKNLSGGERQRVAIARALVNRPKVILADEPTGALDSTNRNMILDIIYDYLDETKSLLFVTHDLENNRRGNQKIMNIKDGVLSIAKP